MNDLDIRHNEDASRYEMRVEDQLCLLEYQRSAEVMSIDHVRVPPALEGRGLAGQLTRHVLDQVRARGERVIPRCPYVSAWIRRNPDYADLVAG